MRHAAGFLGLLLAGAALAAEPGPAPDRDARTRSDVITQGLLDPATLADRRAELAARLEAFARESEDPAALYAVGSLYRLGSEVSSTSPYRRDVDKAREYLTRSALKGQLAAMGKLALLEHDERNRFEANLWAQLRAYYALQFERDQPSDAKRDTVGVASVLALVQEGFPKRDLPRLEERIDAIIKQYDKPIRAGAERIREQLRNNPLRNARGDVCHLTEMQAQQGRVRRDSYYVGGAEYYVSFAEDGSASQVWLLDVWPDARKERGLRTCASRYRVDATAANAAKGLVVLLPILLDDARVKLSGSGN